MKTFTVESKVYPKDDANTNFFVWTLVFTRPTGFPDVGKDSELEIPFSNKNGDITNFSGVVPVGLHYEAEQDMDSEEYKKNYRAGEKNLTGIGKGRYLRTESKSPA